MNTDAATPAHSRTPGSYWTNSPSSQVFMFVLVSALAWFFEIFLLLILSPARAVPGFPISFFALLVVHLLPWFAGLQAIVKVRRAVTNQVINATAARLCNAVILAGLCTAYVALASCETAFALACRRTAGS